MTAAAVLEREDADARLRRLIEYRSNRRVFFERQCWIRDKNKNRVKFVLNGAQQQLDAAMDEQLRDQHMVRILVPKARQLGISLYEQLRMLHRTAMHTGISAFTLAHRADATRAIFEKARYAYWGLSDEVRPLVKASNASELTFAGLDSGYRVATAGSGEGESGGSKNSGTGRSFTNHLLHLSEAAYYANAADLISGMLDTVPDAGGTEVVIESTGNGASGTFYEMVQAVLARELPGWRVVFLPWMLAEEYRREPPKGWVAPSGWEDYGQRNGLEAAQLYWAYCKNAEKARLRPSLSIDEPSSLFTQEFPADVTECVAAGERVGTRRGLIPIEEIMAGDFCRTGQVSAAWSNGVRDVVRLRTSLGYELRCTPDHLVALADGSFVEAIHSIGETVILQPPKITDLLLRHEVRIGPKITVTVDVDEDFAEWLGFFMGDGSIYGGAMEIACDAKDPDVAERVEELNNRVLGHSTSIKTAGSKGGCLVVRVNDRRFGEILDALGCTRQNARQLRRRDVCVPEVIFRSPLSVIRAFLRGLFEADGFCAPERARILLFAKQADFLAEVQQLLLMCGITSRRILDRPRDNGRYLANELALRRSEVDAFAEQIGFVGRRKNGRLMSTGKAPTSGYGRPKLPMELKDVVEEVTADGECEVFDLSVPGEHTFDAGGILVHNCFQQETGDQLIRPDLMLAARARTLEVDETAPIVLGVDVGRNPGQGDPSVIIDRQGRRAGYNVYERWWSDDTMHTVGRVVQQIKRLRPAMVFVDLTGIGAGVYDRLVELGYGEIVSGIHFGSTETVREPTRFPNKRTEMWVRSLEWLKDDGPDIIDEPRLQESACSVRHTFDSSGRYKLEDKAKTKQRLQRSPDEWDALALTFAEDVASPAVLGVPGLRGQWNKFVGS